jgi:hypothetical protein
MVEQLGNNHFINYESITVNPIILSHYIHVNLL